jgi:hypothetical protein
MSPASVSACTGSVKVLNDQLQPVIQYQECDEHPCVKPTAKLQKFCTKVENGRVVVRLVDDSTVGR